MKKRAAIGIDIGGTRTKSGLVDLEKGIVLETIITPTEKKDSEVFLQIIGSAIDKLKTAASEKMLHFWEWDLVLPHSFLKMEWWIRLMVSWNLWKITLWLSILKIILLCPAGLTMMHVLLLWVKHYMEKEKDTTESWFLPWVLVWDWVLSPMAGLKLTCRMLTWGDT